MDIFLESNFWHVNMKGIILLYIHILGLFDEVLFWAFENLRRLKEWVWFIERVTLHTTFLFNNYLLMFDAAILANFWICYC